MPRIVPPTDEAIAQAAAILRAGGVVAFPTETVYGLGADTFNQAALELVYQLKGRPLDNPIIAHVLDVEQARQLINAQTPKRPNAQRSPQHPALGTQHSALSTQHFLLETLAAKFWPGPLTLVLPKNEAVPDRATAGLPTIAVRAPAHPVARQLLQAFGGPISAPSANRSGRVSPTTAQHVAEDLAEEGIEASRHPGIPPPDALMPGSLVASSLLILDGGSCAVGIESTVLDLTTTPPRVLRPGAVTVEQLREALGQYVTAPRITAQAASPGTAEAHYAPVTPAELVERAQLRPMLAESGQALAVLCMDAADVPAPHVAILMPRDAVQYAEKLYAALRQADALGLPRILIERPSQDTGLWRAVQDRLRRATAPVRRRV